MTILLTVTGGRSRLHLLDLSSCGKSSKDDGSGTALSLSALGSVLIALLSGQRHIPHRYQTPTFHQSLQLLIC